MPVRSFEEYSVAYQTIKMSRSEGILEVVLHSDGGSLAWNLVVHSELPQAFREIGADRDNRVVILAGKGENFIGPIVTPLEGVQRPVLSAKEWDRIYWEAKELLMAELDIEVPMIAAVNGPAYRHMELALLCDVVVASEDAVFEDRSHFHSGGLIPGDGKMPVLAALMGVNRARYMLMMGQSMSAKDALAAGLVGEVVAKNQVVDRAREIARSWAQKSDLMLRYSRVVLVQSLKKQLIDQLGYGVALEGLAQLEARRESSGQ